MDRNRPRKGSSLGSARDVEPVVTWIVRVRERGIGTPVRIDTPGSARIQQLLGIARRFGVGANTRAA